MGKWTTVLSALTLFAEQNLIAPQTKEIKRKRERKRERGREKGGGNEGRRKTKKK